MNPGLDARRAATIAQNEARREDLIFMRDTGETLTGATRRLGVTVKSLERWCSRHNLSDVFIELRSRETKYLMDRSELNRRNADRRYRKDAS